MVVPLLEDAPVGATDLDTTVTATEILEPGWLQLFVAAQLTV
jgi:hypothetical protein